MVIIKWTHLFGPLLYTSICCTIWKVWRALLSFLFHSNWSFTIHPSWPFVIILSSLSTLSTKTYEMPCQGPWNSKQFFLNTNCCCAHIRKMRRDHWLLLLETPTRLFWKDARNNVYDKHLARATNPFLIWSEHRKAHMKVFLSELFCIWFRFLKRKRIIWK